MANGWGGKRANQNGRPSLLKSEQLAALSMRCVELTKKYIDDKSVDLKDRAEVFSRIATKVMPQDINLGGQADNPLSVVQLVTMNDNSNPDASSVKGD
jgi:hypothetical protein